jgi:hypothetical protein
MKKSLLFWAIALFSLPAFSKVTIPKQDLITSLYSSGKYEKASEELQNIYNDYYQNNRSDYHTRGFISYWLALSYSKNLDFPKAIKYFKKALELKFHEKDLYYEFAQALFASDKLHEAKIYFNESFKEGFKIGVSLYYMAYISKEIGEITNAKNLYLAISKLPKEESKDVLQASLFQTVDIIYEETEKSQKSVNLIEEFIIPKYESVLKIDENSYLAPKIKEKIIELQKKYQLVLFQLRNGRPTVFPRTFLRVAQEISYDTNVVFAPTETTLTKSELASPFSKTEVFGRHTFYYKDYLGLSPELRFNYSRFFNREDNIKKNDNLVLSPSLRSSYEHKLFSKPASFLIDYEFTHIERDLYAEDTLKFASRSHALMFGERFSYFEAGATTLRFKFRKFESYLESTNSQTMSLILEQSINLKTGSALFYSSLDKTNVEDENFNTNAFTLRGDYLSPPIKNFNPSLGLAFTASDPVNNRSTRGLEKLINPGVRVGRRIDKYWGLNFKYDYFNNISKDKENFGYEKHQAGLELDYIF